MPSRPILLLLLVATLYSAQTLAHEQAIIVGSSESGQLKVHADFEQPVILPVSVFPGITGYAFGELGIHSAAADEPDEDLFTLSSAASLQFILLAKDPGAEVWNDHGSAYLPVGGTFFVGEPIFDTHPVWNIPNIRQINPRSLTLMFHDMNGIYDDSDPVTLSFKGDAEPHFFDVFGDRKLILPTAVPEPTAVFVLLGAAAPSALRRHARA